MVNKSLIQGSIGGDSLVFKRDTFGIALFELCFGGVHIRKHLEMIDVADACLLVGRYLRWRIRRKMIIASATPGMAISAPARISSREIPP